jgi:hypothetical protein
MKPIDGRFQFFYCTRSLAELPHPDVPTRDVTNTHGQNYKTEPYLEKRVENWCPCRARFITPATLRARDLAKEGGQHYLLLTTRRPSDGHPFVVAIMPFAERAFLRLCRCHPGKWSERAHLPYVSDDRMKIVGFESAFSLWKWMKEKGLRAIPGGRGGRGRVPEELLSRIRAHFSAKPDRTRAFLANVKALERRLKNSNPTAWDDYNRRLGRRVGPSKRTRTRC